MVCCKSNKLEVGFFKLYENAVMPQFGTQQAACFDLRAHLITTSGMPREIKFVDSSREYTCIAAGPSIIIPPNSRALVPTGLVAKIPEGFSMRIHVRSGIALKRGLCLANGEGIVDSDYYNELFMLVLNTTNADVTIEHGEKICQGELVPVLRYALGEIHIEPTQTSDRVGGFGSTGV